MYAVVWYFSYWLKPQRTQRAWRMNYTISMFSLVSLIEIAKKFND